MLTLPPLKFKFHLRPYLSSGVMVILLKRFLWLGVLMNKPDRMHVQNIEQLYAHDHYQNVTEHKPQATVYETKSTAYAYAQPKTGSG